MQSVILRMRRLICVLTVAMLVSDCKSKDNLEDQITVTINCIDDNTKQNRVNMFDTIYVRVARLGFPARNYVKIGEYITDSTGSVKVKLNKNEEYRLMINKRGFLGSTWLSKGELRDGKKINIEVFSLEDR